MAIEVFNRYEHKYLIDEETFQKVLEVLEEHMEPDFHNIGRKPYIISNIYYDTSDDFLIRHSLSKPLYKEKLRLRSYGIPGEEDKVFLEIKKKFNGKVNKRRTKLTLEVKSYMNEQVLKELEYFLQIYALRPKLYLAYDRIAYFEKENNDLRISFDMNIRSRRYDLKLEDGDFGDLLLDEGMYLMEVKTSLAKPLWLTHMLDELEIRRRSFSKYGTEYTNMIRERVQKERESGNTEQEKTEIGYATI